MDPFAPKTPNVETAPAVKVSQSLEVDLQSRFAPFEKQAKEWEAKAKALVVTDASQTELMKEARTARLALRQIRLNVKKLHEQEKADALRKGQVLDMIKRKLEGLITPLEDHLQAQEDFAALQEAKHKKELLAQRLQALEPYRTPGDRLELVPFGEMDDGAFDSLLIGLKAAKEAREAKAKADEAARQEAESKAKAEREKTKAEAERLNRANQRIAYVTGKMGLLWDEESHRYQLDELGITMQDINDLNTQEFQELINELLPKVKEKKEAIAKRQQEQEAELARQRDALQKLEQEKREREQKEETERKEKAAAERKAKRAPDKVRLLNFAERIALIEQVEFSKQVAPEVVRVYNEALIYLNKAIDHIRAEAEKL